MDKKQTEKKSVLKKIEELVPQPIQIIVALALGPCYLTYYVFAFKPDPKIHNSIKQTFGTIGGIIMTIIWVFVVAGVANEIRRMEYFYSALYYIAFPCAAIVIYGLLFNTRQAISNLLFPVKIILAIFGIGKK